jgi:hypothetical protein
MMTKIYKSFGFPNCLALRYTKNVVPEMHPVQNEIDTPPPSNNLYHSSGFADVKQK